MSEFRLELSVENNAVEQGMIADINKNLDEQTSKTIALKLLQAISAEDVKAVLNQYSGLFNNPDNWRFYSKWNIAGNQQANPSGALTELIVNSMDACLIRKAKENGIIDFSSPDTPQSMREAVKRFYDIPEGKIENIDSQHANMLADKSIAIGIKRATGSRKYPTYTLLDFGEGQKPENFKDTFVSVNSGNSNKEGIPFVQGKFKMGSTGVFRYLTQGILELGRYKLIISKQFEDDRWAWTLVRLRKAKPGEADNVLEYFSPYKTSVPYFKKENIHPFDYQNMDEKAHELFHNQEPHLSTIKQGTIIKLYEFAMNETAFTSPMGGLDKALSVNLMRCALPIRSIEFDNYPTKEGKKDTSVLADLRVHKRTAYQGSAYYFRKKTTNLVSGFPDTIAGIQDNQLGRVDINIFASNKSGDFFTKHNKRIFYTINGQVHFADTKGIFNRIKLGVLENYVAVEVVCDNIDKSQISEIFMSNRETMSGSEVSKKLRKKVKDALKKNQKLRELAHAIRLKSSQEAIEQDDSALKIAQDLVDNNPEIKNIFGLGADIKLGKQGKEMNFEGKQFPTFFKCDKGEIEIPINSYKRIAISTDAQDDYFSRWKDAGFFAYDNDEVNIASTNLSHGKFTITAMPWANAKVGDSQVCQFSVSDCHNVEPLSCEVLLKIGERVEKMTNPPSPPNPKVSGRKLPPIKFENKGGSICDFDDISGAKIIHDEEGVTIYVNRHNKYLLSVLKRKEKDERERYLQVFKNAVGYLTLAIDNKLRDTKEEYDIDKVIEESSAAIATCAIAVVETTGKHICNL